MIDIIIPAYNAHSTIKKTLASIAMQKNIKDINVYVIDDCSEKDYNETYNLFKDRIQIKLYRLGENKGPGYARQYGLNKSKSDYIIFMDSDDCFYDYSSAEYLQQCIDNEEFDVGVGKLAEYHCNKIYEYTVGFDVLHAKVYRRSFLKLNNIIFPDMYNSEDLSFNNLVMMCNPKINYIDKIIYVYNRKEDSLTMQRDYYSEKHIKCYVENLLWTIYYAELKQYDRVEIAKIIISSFAYLYYFFYNNMKDMQIEYIYKLIPKYNEYEFEIDIEAKKKLVEFWVERFEECPIEYSYEDFILFCKKNVNKHTISN